MNEMDMVRELLGEPRRASRQATAAALARLEDDMAAGPGRSGGTRTTRTTRTARSHRRWAFGGVGAGLAAAAAVVGVIATSGGVPSSRPGGTPAARPLTARVVLLAAAEKAETVPDTGTYWHVKTLSTSGERLGPDKRPYVMTTQSVSDLWTTRDGQAWIGTKDLPMRPASPTDEAAWKADGSPTTWDLGPGDTADRAHVYRYKDGQAGRLIKAAPPHVFVVCDKVVTYRQLAHLPTAPAALRDRMVAFMNGNADGRVPVDARRDFVTRCLGNLLVDVPASAKVRAAAYRALADMPGVRLEENVTDERGRRGVAVTFRGNRAVDPTFRLIIDPADAVVLAQSVQQPGKLAAIPHKNGTVTYLQVGWTDQRPKAPTGP